jgi:hypothetical protein
MVLSPPFQDAMIFFSFLLEGMGRDLPILRRGRLAGIRMGNSIPDFVSSTTVEF